jgi:hypothetical protein
MTSADKINTDAQKRRPVIIGAGQSIHPTRELKEIKSRNVRF